MPGCNPPDKAFFEGLYRAYNHPKYIHPDPLEFVYRYNADADREIVGLIASCLAYGRVAQIIKSVGVILDAMGASPREFIDKAPENKIRNTFKDFKHRFTDGREAANLIRSIKRVIKKHGSLESCLCNNVQKHDTTIIPALDKFVCELTYGSDFPSLLPRPSMGSACKRLNLYLKWMIRHDGVDLGCWKGISPSLLIMPVDTHIFRICRDLGITARKSADMKTALEITAFFKRFNPDDPLKYDFALTRPGIWNGNIPDECRQQLNQEVSLWMT